MTTPAARGAAGPPGPAAPDAAGTSGHAAAAWSVLGTSVRGRSHETAGTSCQDASDWIVTPGLTCLAVADGAGSRPLSGDGAALAVRCAVQTAALLAGQRSDPGAGSAGRPGSVPAGRTGKPGSPADLRPWLRRIFSCAREQIAALASGSSREADDYATTLAVALLADDAIGIGQIGDSIAVTRTAGSYQTVAPAPRNEYVNETSFVTGPGALDELRVEVLDAARVDAVFLSTDGLRFKILADLAEMSPFTPFFEDLAAYAGSQSAASEAVGRFLTGLDDQSGDDKTIVAAVRLPAGA